MGRTPLYDDLRRLAAKAFAGDRDDGRSDDRAEHDALPRRREILTGGLGAVAIAGLAGCGPRGGGTRRGESIVVVGAGLAGLTCASRLAARGARVEVFEAGSRVGGRTFTARGQMPDAQVVELGGELVNSDHLTMRALVAELGLTLDEIKSEREAALDERAYRFRGRVVPPEEIVGLFRPVAAQMAAASALAERDAAASARLDQTAMPDWLTAVGADPLLREILCTAYTAEYGLEAAQQTVFNLIDLIDYEQPSPFRLLGDSDERYHVHGGNDQIALGLAARLGDRVQLGAPLVALAARPGGGYRLSFERGGSAFERLADRVVLALPFATLRRVDLSRAGLPDAKRKVIAELGYGTNSKLMMGFGERVWATRYGAAGGEAVTDEGPQMTWDSSRGQAGEAGVMTVFAGGEVGVRMAQRSPTVEAEAMLATIERLYPGAAAAALPGRIIRKGWSTERYAAGSYACYRPGQRAFAGSEAAQVGAIHFCGEHTSVEHQGFMEGAAESGVRVAREILGGG